MFDSHSPSSMAALAPNRATALRTRLLLAIGIAPLFASGSGCDDCPSFEPEEITISWPIDSDSGGACPATLTDAQLSEATFPGSDFGWIGCGDASYVARDADLCSYTITCTQDYCCGYGRPYFDSEGATVTSDAVADEAWSSELPVSVADLTPAERDQLAEFWLENAAAEHSSVAGFHRFALDLLAHGAPPELVLRAQEAAGQEIRHAIDCYSLASAYAGRRLGPGPLALGPHAPIAGSLAELAAWTVRDGAIGETVAAFLAAEALQHAVDPDVRDALEVVVRDETAHAELALQTLRWALEEGGDEVRSAIHRELAALREPGSQPAPSSRATVAHGMLPPEVRDIAARRCLDEVIGPVMQALLAAPLAA